MSAPTVITPYTPSESRRWDAFVTASRAPSFIHRRGYMDYHADRFPDASLIARRGRTGQPLAILPASRRGNVVTSHGGLTYGGWITPLRHFGAETMLDVFAAALDHYRSVGAESFIYKPIPHIYAVYPAEDDIYAVYRLGGRLESVLASSAYPLEQERIIRSGTSSAISLARRSGYVTAESDDFPRAYELLAEVLDSRYSAAPVHTLDELTMLTARFPENIKLFTATAVDGVCDAMIVAYITPRVVHTQYMAANERGRACGALSLLADSLPALTGRSSGWIDFGTSNEDAGTILNVGLARQKAGLGGRTVAAMTFRIDL